MTSQWLKCLLFDSADHIFKVQVDISSGEYFSEDVGTSIPVLLLLSLPVAASVFVNHFAAIVGIWHKLEPMRLNWVNSSSLLSRQLCLLLPLLPHPSLLLLQPHLLLVRLVPPALLHQPLVRSQPGVSWGSANK